MKQEFKTGEEEAMWVLSRMFTDSHLEISDKPDILRYLNHDEEAAEGIEVVTCAQLDRKMMGIVAKHGINSNKDAKGAINSIKESICLPLDNTIYEAIKRKIEKWESGTYQYCKVKSIAVVVSDALSDTTKTKALFLNDNNETIAEDMSGKIAILCKNSIISHVYVIFLEAAHFQSDKNKLEKQFSIYTYRYKGLLKNKCFTTNSLCGFVCNT